MTFQADAWRRVRARCVWDGDCLIWQGALNGCGYGVIRVNGRNVRVHRIAYDHAKGPVPKGLVLDHVRKMGCVSRACCNAAHLEAVTNRVNILRGVGASAQHARQTHCISGHLLVAENLRPPRGRGRECRLCYNRSQRGARARRMARAL